MSRVHSFPKDKIKILLLEGVHISAIKDFEKRGYVDRFNCKSDRKGKAIICCWRFLYWHQSDRFRGL